MQVICKLNSKIERKIFEGELLYEALKKYTETFCSVREFSEKSHVREQSQ